MSALSLRLGNFTPNNNNKNGGSGSGSGLLFHEVVFLRGNRRRMAQL